MAALVLLLLPHQSVASGTWTRLTTSPPTSVNEALVLSDGSILTDNGSGNCARLTPDIHGSYVNGTWTQLPSMNNGRLFFSTELLTNGNVFVAGGEYGPGGDHGEVYDPLRNTWTEIVPDPVPAVSFSDCISAMLPDGNVLLAPVSEFGGMLIYNVGANTWQTAASTANQDETCWVKLANNNILTLETGTQTAEHYVPALNEWITDNSVPVPLYGYGAELGPGFLLPNGNVFYIGATTNTAIYTPGSSATSAGTWTVGPSMAVTVGTNFIGLGGVDAPAAMMADGNILCALGPVATNGITAGGFNSPTYFMEYNYSANSFTQVASPTGGTTLNTPTYPTSMLDLPDGNVLFISGQNTTSLYVYSPSGAPLAAGQPVINSITEQINGSYELAGTGLNGISAGAAYGDDEQMNSNYPLVRMTNNATGYVYYARTYNWNNTGVQTGAQLIAAYFTLPQNLPAGAYSLSAVANGIASAPTTFTYSPVPVPTGLTAASGSNGFVTLSWNATTGATAYNVKRSSTINGYYSTLATLTSLAYTNTGVTNGLTYFYKIAAVGSGGPSSDSAAVTGTPAGPTLIPGAAQISLSPYYNRTGLFTDGTTFSSGVDGSYSAYSATLLGPSLWWNNLAFRFGPSNALDVVSCAGQTINLPAGRYNTLQILATGVQGSQPAQTFTVTYTDNSTATFTQSFSDWANPQSYPGEFTVVTMPYRDLDSGSTQALNVTVDSYVFTLDQTRTAQSITLPNNSDVVLLAMIQANEPVNVPLSAFYNRAGLYTDGTTFTNPATGGMDGGGEAYSASLLGSSQTWSNSIFAFGPPNATNVVSCASQTVPLPAGNYSRLQILGTGVQGDQASQSLLVTYTDGTTASFAQNFSDWFTPANYSGESKALIMSYRNNADGTEDTSTFYLYGYSYALNSAKTVQSVRLPSDGNVIITAIDLVPDWPPTFKLNPFTLPGIMAGNPYSGTIATNAGDLNGNTLTYAKVSGPAWLNVAANGALSGTPLSPDIGTNNFNVSVTDPGGFSSTATLNIAVTAAPPIISGISAQSGSLLLNWSGGIAPFQVQMTTNLVNPVWQDVGGTTTSASLAITPSNSATFYRILGQ